jgi:hypothetical protein
MTPSQRVRFPELPRSRLQSLPRGCRSHQPAPGRADEEQRRATRPARNLEYPRIRPDPQLGLEPSVLISRRPRELADVFTERLSTNGRVQLVHRPDEVPIVKTCIARLRHYATLHRGENQAAAIRGRLLDLRAYIYAPSTPATTFSGRTPEDGRNAPFVRLPQARDRRGRSFQEPCQSCRTGESSACKAAAGVQNVS